jgi:hypothetical protein
MGMLAIVASVYACLYGSPALGPGPFDVHWNALSKVEWTRGGAPRLGVCGFLAIAGLILLVQGVEELNDD